MANIQWSVLYFIFIFVDSYIFHDCFHHVASYFNNINNNIIFYSFYDDKENDVTLRIQI